MRPIQTTKMRPIQTTNMKVSEIGKKQETTCCKSTGMWCES